MEATTAESALATVQRFAGFIMEGNLDEACKILSDDFVAHEAPGLPYGGEYHGPDGFRELLGNLTAKQDMETLDIALYAAGNLIINHAQLRFTRRDNGESVDMWVAELFTVSDGRIVDL